MLLKMPHLDIEMLWNKIYDTNRLYDENQMYSSKLCI